VGKARITVNNVAFYGAVLIQNMAISHQGLLTEMGAVQPSENGNTAQSARQLQFGLPNRFSNISTKAIIARRTGK
jgi:hypothetical protein